LRYRLTTFYPNGLKEEKVRSKYTVYYITMDTNKIIELGKTGGGLAGWIALIVVGALFHNYVMAGAIIGTVLMVGLLAFDIYKKRKG